jgi:hypothetical protein
MAETYILAMRCPVYRRRESIPGFRTELENLTGDDKGKGTSGMWPPELCGAQQAASIGINRVMVLDAT